MKNWLLLSLCLCYFYGNAQVPQSFNYQAQARDSNGDPLVNQSISIRISILDGSATGSIDYREAHNVSTDENGIFSLAIGNGTLDSGVFTDIDWSGGQKFLKVELDQSGGSSYVDMGTTQLLSVPFALQAGTVTNDKYIDDDADSTNELQIISITNDTISLSDGGFIVLPQAPIDNDRDSTNELQIISKSGTTITLTDGGSFEDADADPTNELQDLSSVLTQGNDAGVTKITNLLNPTDAQDAATKAYIDNLIIQIGRADKLLSAGYSIQQLLDGGQTVSDLLNAGVSETDLLAAGVSAADISAAWIVQQRLNNGETPFEIYNSNNNFLDSLYGKTYQGGLIFYFDTSTGMGLVTTPFDLGQTVWGCFGTTISGADGTTIGTGLQNTLDILAGCSETGIAAKLCADLSLGGYDDWYLPSKDEIIMLWTNSVPVAASGDDFIVNIAYWSSTEISSNLALAQDLSDGDRVDTGNGKTDLYFIRAVRAF